jgi:hypothetical protein
MGGTPPSATSSATTPRSTWSGEQLLRPLALSVDEIDDLVAFLETLTDPRATVGPPPVTGGAGRADREPGCPR